MPIGDFIDMLIIYLLTIPLFLLTIYYLWEVSTTYPGYSKKRDKKENKLKFTKDDFLKNSENDKDKNSLIIKGKKVNLKFCETCCIIREPRSFHCNICGFCILKHGK